MTGTGRSASLGGGELLEDSVLNADKVLAWDWLQDAFATRRIGAHHGHPPALHLGDAVLAPRIAALFQDLCAR